MNQDQKTNAQNLNQQVIEAIKKANNVLVTVSQNPSVDQLSSCIGLALILNKLNKHATAIFSGSVPSTIEFLQPEKMLETNTDSLRDFIISLDKAKADKLRYKVEDEVVRIFITPYRTSLSQNDLVFSQGDFNVDVVIALGVDQREHLDLAIMQQGRILHDAVVIGISAGSVATNVGALNMHDPTASSIAELVVILANSIQNGLLDEQISTALLTGIVAETDRFRNEKTSARVMSVSAQLMSSGANQQLIAQKIETQIPVQNTPNLNTAVTTTAQNTNGPEFDVPKEGEKGPKEASVSLHVDPNAPAPAVQLPGEDSEEIKKINIDEHGVIHDDVANLNNDQLINKPHKVIQPLSDQNKTEGSNYIFTPPSRGGTLTAADQDNSMNEAQNPAVQAPLPTPIINRDPEIPEPSSENETQNPDINQNPTPAIAAVGPEALDSVDEATANQPLGQEPDAQAQSTPDNSAPQNLDQDEARKAVLEAMAGGPPGLPSPMVSLNAQPMDIGSSAPAQSMSVDLPPPALPPPIAPIPEPLMPPSSDSQPAPSGNMPSQPQAPQGNTPFNLPPPQ